MLSRLFDSRDPEQLAPLLDSIEHRARRAARVRASRRSWPTARLLGAVREGGLIGHDSDADLGYVSRRHQPAEAVAESFRLQRRPGRARAAGDPLQRDGASASNVAEADGGSRGLDVFGGFMRDGQPLPHGRGRRARSAASGCWPLSAVHPRGAHASRPRAEPERLLEAMYGPDVAHPGPGLQVRDAGDDRTAARRLVPRHPRRPQPVVGHAAAARCGQRLRPSGFQLGTPSWRARGRAGDRHARRPRLRRRRRRLLDGPPGHRRRRGRLQAEPLPGDGGARAPRGAARCLPSGPTSTSCARCSPTGAEIARRPGPRVGDGPPRRSTPLDRTRPRTAAPPRRDGDPRRRAALPPGAARRPAEAHAAGTARARRAVGRGRARGSSPRRPSPMDVDALVAEIEARDGRVLERQDVVESADGRTPRTASRGTGAEKSRDWW